MAWPTTVDLSTLSLEMKAWDADVNDNFRHVAAFLKPDHALHVFDAAGSDPSGADRAIWSHDFQGQQDLKFGDDNADTPNTKVASGHRFATVHTSAPTLNLATGGRYFLNTGAAALLVVTMPTGFANGTRMRFIVADPDGWQINNPPSGSIRVAGSVAVTHIVSTTVGSSIELMCFDEDARDWLAVLVQGTWTVV